jgi:hypothetical protein
MIRIFRVLSVVVALLFCSMNFATAQAPCPSDASALAADAKLSCTCATGASGGVYGSARYTADSSICAAAVHAGKVPASGGAVNIVVGGACTSFTGTSANGVTTTSWSSYDKTFGFDTLPACAVAAAPAAPTAPAAATAGGVADCPSFIGQSDKNKPGDSLTCVCQANIDYTIGAAYGTDRYSHDSPICMSAKHAGKLPQPSGTITVYAAEGCGKFDGTARNGITTRSWGSTTPGTIAFVTPTPACAAPAAPAPSTATAPRPPAAPAGPHPRIAWEARAKTYAPFLPEPLDGNWKPGERTIETSPGGMGQDSHVGANRFYVFGFDPVNRNRVRIEIYNKTDGSPPFPVELWRDPAKRKTRTDGEYVMTKVEGRDALEWKPTAGGGGTIYFFLKNNLFVGVQWEEYGGVTRAHAGQYIKKLDFAKIEALASK